MLQLVADLADALLRKDSCLDLGIRGGLRSGSTLLGVWSKLTSCFLHR